MADLIIKPLTGAGNTVRIQDQAGGAILTSADSGATLGSGITFPVHLSTGLDYDFSGTINFDNCGRSGYYGPTLTQARSSYTGEYLQGTWLNDVDYFNVIAGVQYFRIPKTGTWTYIVKGAKGGNYTHSGLGRSITSTATLYAGEWIKMVCGHQGSYSANNSNGGGGGSYIAVFRMGDWLPLCVAGGGAGFSGNSPDSANSNRNGFAPGAGKGDAITAGGNGSFYNMTYAEGGNPISEDWCGGGGGGWSSPGSDGMIGHGSSSQLIGGRALGYGAPIGGLWSLLNDGSHSGSGGSTVVNNGGFGGGGGTGHSGGGAGGGGGWWGGNSTFSIGTSSDDTDQLGGGSHSMNSYTDNGTHSGVAGSVALTL
jgi:hypothetical protein